MTWLHMEFVLIFITGPSRAKLGRMARQQLLTLALLDLTYFQPISKLHTYLKLVGFWKETLIFDCQVLSQKNCINISLRICTENQIQ